jgi:hypothetical protein
LRATSLVRTDALFNHASREEIANVVAALGALEDQAIDREKATAKLDLWLAELFDGPARMRIDEVGAAICAPNDRGGREALESFISSGVPGTLHRGVRPEIYAHFERENVRAVLVSSIQKHSHEGISDAERAKTKAELELRLDAKSVTRRTPSARSRPSA